MKIIECVPNLSEGRDKEKLEKIKNRISSVPGVNLLSFEPDADYNRVVITFAGEPEAVLNGALETVRAGAEHIDMRTHKGEHPRLGAADVVPFIPVKNATIEECAALAERFGEQISRELNLPVYLYEGAARTPQRKNLSDIRKGEYEGLEAKLKDPEWKPDFGEAVFNPKLGATVTGTRFFLIAYNVNLKTTDLSVSKDISEIIRESGRVKRDENGNPVKVDGKTIKEPGRFKAVKAMGVTLEKYGITQVSINLTNYTISNMHQVFEEVKKEAALRGVETMGSEIVGLVPLAALLESGRYFAGNQQLSDSELAAIAVEKLGLSALAPFKPEEKIIEYMVEK
ncbi:MAG: glutamate formimidoyltransferase [Ignavibacteriaceae bacterium]|nr:glutamate formimidoyltransferase [Ignavibacteriaceae bacterium]